MHVRVGNPSIGSDGRFYCVLSDHYSLGVTFHKSVQRSLAECTVSYHSSMRRIRWARFCHAILLPRTDKYTYRLSVRFLFQFYTIFQWSDGVIQRPFQFVENFFEICSLLNNKRKAKRIILKEEKSYTPTNSK